MTKPYSIDLRERVVARIMAGEPVRSAARTFGVSVASAVKWSQRFRAMGSAAPDKMGGHRKYMLEPERDWLLMRLGQTPDVTLHELLHELRERGVSVCCDTLWRFLRHAGVSFKKNPVRHRTGPSRRRPKTRAVESPSRQA